MAFSQWWSFREGMVNSDREEGGVYELADAGSRTIYIGSSRQIRTRMRQHLSEEASSCIRQNATQYRIDYRSDYAAEELKLYDKFVRENGKPPKCNKARPAG
jgi:predicted GIY-YIG superfamily endonuclease